MAKGGCADGLLDLSAFPTPIPWIGLYIAAATLVCFIFMTRDFLNGLIRRKPFLPCKWFQMNALTLTLLGVATKIPVDLTASMPRAEDQLSKLTGTALLCTAIGFYMPSLGTMDTSERYSNMVALSMMVITVVVNVCIQMRTGSIFAFTTEHIIIIVCILVLLLLMWSSAIAFGGLIEFSKSKYTFETGKGISDDNDVQKLEELLKKLYVLNYTGNPQSLLCETSHHYAFGLLCVLSFIVVLQATLRSIVFKTMRFCNGVDDYQWSIPFVIATQLLTIGVGTCSIIYRWYSFIRHTYVKPSANDLLDSFVVEELENLKLKTLSYWVFEKNISAVLQVPKDIIMELLIRTQVMLYGCSTLFIGRPIYGVKTFFEFIIAIFYSGCPDHDEEEQKAMPAISSCDYSFDKWIAGMATKEYERWKKKYKERLTKQKNENPIIPSISKWGHRHPSKSECFVLGGILRSVFSKVYGRFQYFDDYKYKVSSLSVLVFSRMLKELMPSSSSFPEESSKALDESFDIIYYVDHKSLGERKGFSFAFDGWIQTRFSLTKNVWANWKDPKHWFHELISNTLPKNSENSENYLDQLHQVLNHASLALRNFVDGSEEDEDEDENENERQFIWKQKKLILIEISVLCQFILKKKHESIEDLIDFLEKSFVKMLRLTLSDLPKAILKEIQGDYPYGICEGNVREGIKFFYVLKSLENIVEWSWEDEVLSENQEKEVESFFLDAPSTGADHPWLSRRNKSDR